MTEVFVQSFLNADIYQARNPETIRLAFVSHLKSLRRAENLKNMGRDAREKIATRARRDERKRNVSHRSSFSPQPMPTKQSFAFSFFIDDSLLPKSILVSGLMSRCSCIWALME